MADRRRSHPAPPLYPGGSRPLGGQVTGGIELDFDQINDRPTTLAGYGITDAPAVLDDLTDVNAPTPADGDLLVWDDLAGEWVNVAASGGSPHTLDSHTDVNAPAPNPGDVLTWDDVAGEWIAAPGSGGSTATDVATGTVKTDVLEADPVVYTKASTDTLLADKQDAIAQDVVQVVTASLADAAEETGTVSLGKNGFLLKIVADRACWVRLYGTSAERTADAGRDIADDPTVPVLADLIFTLATLTINAAPLIGFANRDGSPAATIYYSIINKSGSTSTVTVDFTRFALEL